MPRILVTAFEPYDRWPENSSWLTLVEFTKELDPRARITTRRYPVDFFELRQRLAKDLAANYDYAIHLGQAPGSAEIRLEAIGLNLGGDSQEPVVERELLARDGPVAYRSALPLSQWAQLLRDARIPARVSYHAGTYLCNATLFLSHYFNERQGTGTLSTFVHLPLDPSQAARETDVMPSLPVTLGARALHLIVAELVKREQLRAAELA